MAKDTLYRDYLADWLKVKRYSYSPHTTLSFESIIRSQIIPQLGDFTIGELSPMVLQTFVNKLIESGLANRSVRQIFTVVSSSLTTAEKMELIPKSHARAVTLPKQRTRELKVWDIEQVRGFLRLAENEPYTYIAFHLAILTGMRQGEILGLRWADVNLSDQLLFVRQTLTQDGKQFLPYTKTSQGTRSIAIDRRTVAVLDEHLQRAEADEKRWTVGYQDSGLVVRMKMGMKMHSGHLRYVWFKLLHESGLPHIRFHDLRHTHASLLLKNNIHPKIVSERLGHASVKTTLDTYSHLLPNLQGDAARRLGEEILRS